MAVWANSAPPARPAAARKSGCRGEGLDGAGVDGTGGDLLGEIGQAQIVGAGVVPQAPECLIHVGVASLGDLAFGLFDYDSAVEGAAQLAVEGLGVVDDPVLQDGDGGDVGESLGGRDISFAKRAALGMQQVEGSEGATS